MCLINPGHSSYISLFVSLIRHLSCCLDSIHLIMKQDAGQTAAFFSLISLCYWLTQWKNVNFPGTLGWRYPSQGRYVLDLRSNLTPVSYRPAWPTRDPQSPPLPKVDNGMKVKCNKCPCPVPCRYPAAFSPLLFCCFECISISRLLQCDETPFRMARGTLSSRHLGSTNWSEQEDSQQGIFLRSKRAGLELNQLKAELRATVPTAK